MTVQGLIDGIVDFQISLEDMAVGKIPAVQKRIGELLNKPKQRNQEIERIFLEDEVRGTVAETGDEQYANMYWGRIADLLELSFEELNSIPVNERGDFFDTARNMMVAIAQYQALVENGLISESILAGVEFAIDKEENLKGVDIQEFADSMDLKNQIMDKRNAVQ